MPIAFIIWSDSCINTLNYSVSQTKHAQELERKTKQNAAAEKKLMKDISTRQEADRKAFEAQRKREYKANKERWKKELSMDDATPKRQRDATLQ